MKSIDIVGMFKTVASVAPLGDNKFRVKYGRNQEAIITVESAQQRLQADMACACPLDEFGMYQMPALPDGTCPTCRKPYR